MIPTHKNDGLSKFQIVCRDALLKALSDLKVSPARVETVKGDVATDIEIDIDTPRLHLWIYEDEGACIEGAGKTDVLEWQDYENGLKGVQQAFIEQIIQRICEG